MSTFNPAFSYIQLSHHGKVPTPAMTGWPDRPRTLPAEVREWLAQGYNLGVRCGPQSQVWVLDIDVDLRSLEHSDEWKALMAEHGEPDTYTVRSPSGGLHYYFRPPQGVEIRNDQGSVVAQGVDIRGKGGYVVAAGMYAEYTKKHTYKLADGTDDVVVREFAGTYDVINDAPIAQTPDWLREIMVGREKRDADLAARRESMGEVAPKAENIDPEWDRFAKDELNSLFAQVDALIALPEGGTMEILGQERGWQVGAGFFTLACKIVEVARWPHTSVTVEQAYAVWRDRLKGVGQEHYGHYVNHEWQSALDRAAPTWAWGEQQRNPVDIFAGVAERGNSQAPGDGGEQQGPWQPLDVSDKPDGWAVAALFKAKKEDEPDDPSGGFQVDVARQMIDRIGPIAIDPSGSLWTYQRGVYINDDSVVLNRLYHMLGNRFTSGFLTNTRLAVQAKARKIDLTRAPNPGVMNFVNGILEWRHTDELTEHSPEMMATTQFPFEWDPTATCPKFDQWLETMLEPDQVVLAWKILGYMMLSGNPLQVAFMLYGKGSNGKSTFAHVIERLVGTENTSAVALKEFNQRFSTSSMIGKIANVVGDIDSDYQMSTAALKQVTGADAMQFERKNRDSFRATLWATCLFSANRIPGTNDGSEGYAERWVPLHFKRKASDYRIVGFTEEGLFEEVPGIAAKAVRMLRTLPLHQGSSRNAAFDLTSDSAKEAVEEFREASNSYYAWVKNHTVPSETEVIKPKDLWAAYKVATGSRVGGTNCPREFADVLNERYGESKMVRGLSHGVQVNIKGYRVAIVDEDTEGQRDPFFDIVGSQQS